MGAEIPSSIISEEPFQFCGRGEVWSYTIVTRECAPEEFKEYAPYIIAIVKLEEGPLTTAQLTDLDWHWEPDGEKGEILRFKVYIGMPVESVTRKCKTDGRTGIIVYRDKFRSPIRPFNGKGQPEPLPENSLGETEPGAG